MRKSFNFRTLMTDHGHDLQASKQANKQCRLSHVWDPPAPNPHPKYLKKVRSFSLNYSIDYIQTV